MMNSSIFIFTCISLFLFNLKNEEIEPLYISHWKILTCKQHCEKAEEHCISDCTNKFNQANNNCTQPKFSLRSDCIKVREDQEICYEACEVMRNMCKTSCN